VLASSTTFASAMLAQVSLRSMSAIGCSLAAVWALSPVGGQASLRIMSIGKMLVTTSASFDYLSTNNSYGEWLSSSGASSFKNTAIGLYLASLTAPQRMKDSPTDLWDNVKIPMLEDIPGWTGSADATDTWYEVPQENVSYSSLIGIPVSGIDSIAETATFSLETSYWRLECPIVQRGSACDMLEEGSFPTNHLSLNYTTVSPASLNILNCSGFVREDWYGMWKLSSSLYTNNSNIGVKRSGHTGVGCESPSTTPVRHLLYSGWPTYFAADADDEQFTAYCTITTSWVEAEVNCQGRECAVQRLRHSQLPHPPPSWTYLDGSQCINYDYFIGWFLGVVDASSSAQGSLPQGYLAYPGDPSLAVHGLVTAPNPGDINPSLFAQRLVQLLNTWWVASIGREVVSSGVKMGSVGRDSPSSGEPLRLLTTNSILSHQVDTIACMDPWFITLVAVSAVLIVASVVPLALRLCTHAPAFSLLVSTMLKDSPYFEAPNTGSTLESSDRSRLLRHRRVRFGDVAPGDDIGYLAVGSLSDEDESDGKVGRVERNRLYR